MSTTIKMSARLPKGIEASGTGPLAEQMLTADGVQYLIIAVVPEENIERRGNPDKKIRQVKVVNLHVEGMVHPKDRDAVIELLETAQRRRLNDHEPATGEVHQPMMNAEW